MNYVVDEVKRSRKEDVSILTHPLYFLGFPRAYFSVEATTVLFSLIRAALPVRLRR